MSPSWWLTAGIIQWEARLTCAAWSLASLRANRKGSGGRDSNLNFIWTCDHPGPGAGPLPLRAFARPLSLSPFPLRPPWPWPWPWPCPLLSAPQRPGCHWTGETQANFRLLGGSPCSHLGARALLPQGSLAAGRAALAGLDVVGFRGAPQQGCRGVGERCNR